MVEILIITVFRQKEARGELMGREDEQKHLPVQIFCCRYHLNLVKLHRLIDIMGISDSRKDLNSFNE
mgnify:CR=1 FL=1